MRTSIISALKFLHTAFRPLLHLIAYYPLLLMLVIGLLSLVFGIILVDYDAFHVIWNDAWWLGIANGVLVAFILGVVMVAVHQVDLKAASNPMPPSWSYRTVWILLLLTFASPMVWKQPVDFPDVEPSNGWRWWFPIGLASLAGFYFLGRAVFVRGLASTQRVGWRILIALGGGYAILIAVHGIDPDAYIPFAPTSISAFLLFAFIATGLGLVTKVAQNRRWVYPALFLPLILLFLFPKNQVENRLPHMTNTETGEDYYKSPRRLLNIAALRDPKERGKAGLLNDTETLERWHKLMCDEKHGFGEPQPVVLVTCSGGASASAIYTADVLLTLEEQCPGFSRRIRLVSGASGGMLGAAYFVTQLRPGGLIANARLTPEYKAYVAAAIDPQIDSDSEHFAKLEADYRAVMLACRNEFFRGLEADFLGPIVQKWVHKDIPLSPFGGSTTNDRGAALERAWSTHLRGALDVPFRGLQAEEATGELPSLVFTPMMIEDGRQLIISNLDLDYMTESGRLDGRLMSYTGMQFFDVFPKANDFRLSTAVRMNASFPLFSPAAALPTDPVRHVVDAGYYDNYGMVVATKWLNSDGNRKFLQGEFQDAKAAYGKIPQILILRIKCFGNDQTSKMVPTESELRAYAERRGNGQLHLGQLEETRNAWDADPSTTPVHTEGGLFTMTAPLTGLFSSWRANMIYRSDERLNAAVNRMERKDNGSPGVHVDAPVILCTVEPSLNWVLTAAEREAIHEDVRRFVAEPSMLANFRQQRSTSATVPSRMKPSSQQLPNWENLRDSKNLTPTQLDSLKDKIKLGEFQSKLPLKPKK